MRDRDKTKEQLVGELAELRRRVAELEVLEAEHKRAEGELRRALDATTDGIWKMNFETAEMFFSPRYYAMLGYEPGEFPASYESWGGLIHPDDRESALRAAAEYLAAKPDSYENEFRLRTKTGGYKWVRARARVVERNEKGEAVRMIGSHEDITERKRAEEMLQANQDRMMAFMNSATDAFTIWDANLNLVDLNRTAEGYLPKGVRKEDVIGKTMFDLIPNLKEAGRYNRYMRVIQTGEPITLEDQILDPTYKEHYLDVRAFKMGDGLGLITTDITERKQAEEKRLAYLSLLENLEKVNRVIQQATDLEQMLRGVIDLVFSIFDSDRAWLFYPCDPDAPSFRVPIERARPEYPGALALNIDVPMAPGQADDCRIALESDGPVAFGPGFDRPMSLETARDFSVQSQMFMAIYPKVGKPWLFGIHQCSHTRVWTEEEQRLYKEIGRRISDGLSTLLFLRNLQESEEQLRSTMTSMDDLVFVLDKEGIFRNYYQPPGRSDLYVPPGVFLGKSFRDVMPPHVVEPMSTAIDMVMASGTVQQVDYYFETPEGTKWYSANISMRKDASGNFAGVTAVSRDVTERKQAEEEIRRRAFEQEALRKAMLALTTTLDRNEVIDLILAQLQEVVSYDTASVQLLLEGCLRIVGGRGFPNLEELLGVTFDPNREDNPNREVIRTRSSFVVDDAPTSYAEFLQDPHAPAAIRSWLGVPMLVGERLIGMIALDKCEPGFYTQQHAWMAEAFAAQAAVAIENAQLYQQAQQEISEREQIEKALRESEKKFRNLAEQLPNMIFINKMGKIVYANRRCEEVMGYTRAQFYSDDFDFLALIAPEHRELIGASFGAHMRGKEVEPYEYTVVTRDGKRIEAILTTQLIDYEGEKAILGIVTDITERKRVEKERERLLVRIREQARQMQQIMDTVPEGVLLLDTNGQVVLANPVAAHHLDTLAGARAGDTLTHLGNRPLVEFLISPPKGLWHEIKTDDEVFELVARPMGSGPEMKDWVLVINNVTQQREIEQRIQQQERLAAVGQLAAGVAHDFNNIMASIVLYAQMTARMKGLPTVVRERMETINQQAGHATKLISQILDFSRRAVLEQRPLDLVPLLKEHVRILERTLPENIEIELVYDLDEYAAPLIVHADPTRMQQMITNLAVNARDAMPNGGTLYIGLEHVEVRPGESPLLPEMEAGEWVQVTVSDTGTGISPDALPHIFEPFFTTRAPLGSGLGLAQVHGIVGQHGGRIDVDTRLGQGATFTIYLPALSISGELFTGPSTSLSPLSGQGQTVLVVEDNAVVRKVLVESLETLNYRAMEATNGQEALAMLEQHGDEIDLLLSDVVMPVMGGKALLYALRERGLMVPVVMLTGHPLKKEMEELRMQGMADWLSKPPQLEELAQALARVLKADPTGS